MIAVSAKLWRPLRKFAYDAKVLTGLPRLPLQPGDDARVHVLCSQIPPVPHLLTSWSGPHPIGAQVELLNVDERVPLATYADHCALTLLDGMIHDLGIQPSLVGRAESGSGGNMQLAFWYDLGNARLMVLPSFRLIGRTLSVQVTHVIWHWQGWMTGHNPAKDQDWVDLSTNYREYFSKEGYAYYEASIAYGRKNFYWGVYRSWFDRLVGMVCGRWTDLGKGEVVFGGPDVAPLPILRSERFNSFFHFEVGEPQFSAGSEPGIILQRIRQYVAGMTRDWRTYYGSVPELVQRIEVHVGVERRIAERE